MKIRAILTELSEDSRLFVGGNHYEVKVLDYVPDPVEFILNYVLPNRPVIIKGYAKQWKAMTKWTTEYLLSEDVGLAETVQDIAAVPCGAQADAIGDDDRFELPEIKQMKFKEFINHFESADESGSDTQLYLQQQNDNLRQNFKQIQNDVPESIVLFDMTLRNSTLDAVNYWMGNSGSISSMHRDPYENAFVVIKGQKQFLLLPPTDRHLIKMQDYQTFQWKQNDTGMWEKTDVGFKTRWISNHNRDDLSKRFYCATVNPGDLFYLPAGWYHEVHQCDQTIAVNYWYERIYSPYSCLLETLDVLVEDVMDVDE